MIRKVLPFSTQLALSLIAIALGSQGNERQHIALHQLPGRKLHVHAGKGVVLQHAVSTKTDWNLRNSDSSEAQYLVRVDFSAERTRIQDELRKFSPYVQYLPHDTFVVLVKSGDLNTVANIRGVADVFAVPISLKVDNGLPMEEKAEERRRGHRRGSCSPTFLNVLLAKTAEAAAVASFCNMESGNQTICESAWHASEKKLVVATDACSKGQAAWRLAQHPSIVWIEERREVRTRNKYARRIVQSSDGSSELLWSKNIFGDGEIIGIVDTGVDYNSCFFKDPKVLLPYCVGTGAVRTAGYFKNTNVGDTFEGHGTHVCGSALGSALATSAQSIAPDYNGIAKNAKLAFDDISVDGEVLNIPDDLNAKLFPHSYMAGARTQSLSWGSNETWYDSMAMEVDQFMYAHDDYLVHVAAGNDGPLSYTVGTPATAKNILAVGASVNSFEALREYGDLTPMLRIADGPADAAGKRFIIQPAEFGALVKVGLPTWTGVLTYANPADACAALGGDVRGKIAVIQRGTCEFGTKALNAQNAGAIAAIVVNNVKGDLLIMSAGSDGGNVQIPAVLISVQSGDALGNYMAAGSVTITFPEDADQVLIPGEGQETMNILADFSSRGPTFDQRIKPDVVCPGHHIMSVLSGMPQYLLPCDVNSLVELSGTSMATPICAGSSALVRQYFREGFHVYGWKNASTSLHATSALVKAVMIHSGRPIFNLNSNSQTVLPKLPDISQGYGRVELSSVLYFGHESGFNLSVWNAESVSHREIDQYCLQVHSAAVQLRVTIVWTDPAALPTSSKILVNDLDLVVEAPDGGYYWGNAQTQWDETHGEHATVDVLNNCEQVTVPTPSTGIVTVRVKGSDVPLGPQKYAMVITGSFSMVSDCNQPMRCPNDCSGHGVCDGGTCTCAIAYSGLDCSLQNAVLKSSEPYSLAVSSGGWAYYLLDLPNQDAFWNLRLQVEDGDPDFYLAFNRIPTWDDYDFADAGWWSNIDLTCNASCLARWGSSAQGTWVVGVNSQCCNTSRAVATLRATVVAAPCTAGQTLKDGECKACTTLTCPVGEYRGGCTPYADGSCITCSMRPVGAKFTTSGDPFDHDNCQWACDQGLYWDGNHCSRLNTTALANPSDVTLTYFSSPTASTIASSHTLQTTALTTTATIDATSTLASGSTAKATSTITSSTSLPDATDVGSNVLVFSVVLPMTVAAFSAQKTQYIAAVAATALCSIEQVVVQSIQAYPASQRRGERRLLGESVQVRTGIVMPSSSTISGSSSAQAMVGLLQTKALDENLRMFGLPESLGLTVISSPAVSLQNTSAPTASTPSSNVGLAVGVSVGCAGLAVLGAVAGCYMYHSHKAAEAASQSVALSNIEGGFTLNLNVVDANRPGAPPVAAAGDDGDQRAAGSEPSP